MAEKTKSAPKEDPKVDAAPEAAAEEPKQFYRQAYEPVTQIGPANVPITLADLLLQLQEDIQAACGLRTRMIVSRRGDASELVDKLFEIRANIDAAMQAFTPLIQVGPAGEPVESAAEPTPSE